MKNYLTLVCLLLCTIMTFGQEKMSDFDVLKNHPKTKLTPLAIVNDTLTIKDISPNSLHLFIAPNIQKTIMTDGDNITLDDITYAAKIETPLAADHPLYEKYKDWEHIYIFDKSFKITIASKNNTTNTVQSFSFDKRTRKGAVILQNGQKINVQYDSPFITYTSDEVILHADRL